MEVYDYIAICGEEYQGALTEELKRLGALAIEQGYKAVHFQADKKTAYEIHLQAAIPSRILRVLRRGAAAKERMVFFQALKIDWSGLLPEGARYLIEGIAGDRGPDSPSGNGLSKRVREAIEAHYQKRHKLPPKVDLEDPSVRIVVYYHGKKVTISVVTSGKSMHKRGYKSESHPAPVKEHVASALLELLGYTGEEVFYDPMCGSGTFVIEACYRALHKGALIHRKKGEFGLEHLRDFDRGLWREVSDWVRRQRLSEPKAPIYASDIDPIYVKMARRHALRARVERDIEFSTLDFLTAMPPASKGILIANLPYGERLQKDDEKALADFYQAIGDKLKKDYPGWVCGFLVAENAPWKKIGLRAYRQFKVKNGGIPCRFLLYRLYEGSLKKKHQVLS